MTSVRLPACNPSFIMTKPSGSNSAVECDLAKVEVAGSNPVSRSRYLFRALPERAFLLSARLFRKVARRLFVGVGLI